MTLANLRPGVGFTHLLKLYMQLIILDHPIAFARFNGTTQVFIKERRQTFQSHIQMIRSNFDVKFWQFFTWLKVFLELLFVFRKKKLRWLDVKMNLIEILLPKLTIKFER